MSESGEARAEGDEGVVFGLAALDEAEVPDGEGGGEGEVAVFFLGEELVVVHFCWRERLFVRGIETWRWWKGWM